MIGYFVFCLICCESCRTLYLHTLSTPCMVSNMVDIVRRWQQAWCWRICDVNDIGMKEGTRRSNNKSAHRLKAEHRRLISSAIGLLCTRVSLPVVDLHFHHNVCRWIDCKCCEWDSHYLYQSIFVNFSNYHYCFYTVHRVVLDGAGHVDHLHHNLCNHRNE